MQLDSFREVIPHLPPTRMHELPRRSTMTHVNFPTVEEEGWQLLLAGRNMYVPPCCPSFLPSVPAKASPILVPTLTLRNATHTHTHTHRYKELPESLQYGDIVEEPKGQAMERRRKWAYRFDNGRQVRHVTVTCNCTYCTYCTCTCTCTCLFVLCFYLAVVFCFVSCSG